MSQGLGKNQSTNYVTSSDLLKDEFWMFPKYLLLAENYRSLSNDARILYMLLKDRMRLSVMNSWFDKEGRAFVIFTIEELMTTLNKSRPTVIKIKRELIESLLIEEVRAGATQPNRIFVKVPSPEQLETMKTTYREKLKILKSKNLTSHGKKIELHEVQNFNPSNTYYSKTNRVITDDDVLVSNNYTPEAVGNENDPAYLAKVIFAKMKPYFMNQIDINESILGAADAVSISNETERILKDAILGLSDNPKVMSWMAHSPSEKTQEIFKTCTRLAGPYGDKADVVNKPFYLQTTINAMYAKAQAEEQLGF